uniref:Uncharacterized protein n=1 Tax=Ackermannviridae sp. TaxID=2831612 RepID=A0A8S5VKC2_9CAUD|nr:MAG TPA: hypothetical protein [Ackermannviridae sp.]
MGDADALGLLYGAGKPHEADGSASRAGSLPPVKARRRKRDR